MVRTEASCENPSTCCIGSESSSLYFGHVVFGHLVLFPHLCEVHVEVLYEKREEGGANLMRMDFFPFKVVAPIFFHLIGFVFSTPE